jgi:hypothetical protein
LQPVPLIEPHDPEEVMLTARGIATAVACDGGLTEIQAELLGAIASALTGVTVDYRSLEPLGPEELAEVLDGRELGYRQRIVHHMVLGEMVLKPLPPAVAHRVAQYAQQLGVQDDFVRVARRYAQGAYGLAWMDLQRNGFVDHVVDATGGDEAAKPMPNAAQPFEPAKVDPAVSDRWAHFEELPEGTLGRGVWDLYDGRGFVVPGCPGGAPEYLAQHDFVHVLADYGTNLKGELEVFAFIGRADPDPKGFAWLATLVGLFETGFIADTGFFERDIREHNIQAPGMHERLADAIRRGKVVCETYGVDLFDVDYHELAPRPLEEAREMLRFPSKSERSLEGSWPGTFDVAGMSEIQRQHAASRGKL